MSSLYYRLDSSSLASISTRARTWEEQMAAYEQIRWHLADRASEAAKYAISYRGFKVGCAVFAFTSHGVPGVSPWEIFTGANMKPIKRGPKVCAEQIAIGAARSAGYTLIVGIAVEGVAQEDGVSGLLTRTLHPCNDCRIIMRHLPEVRSETRILTVHTGVGAVPAEEQSFAELLSLHKRRTKKKSGSLRRRY